MASSRHLEHGTERSIRASRSSVSLSTISDYSIYVRGGRDDLIIVGVYFCQGLAIMAFYFKQLRMPAVARGLIYFVPLAQPILMALVGAAGIFDLWVDFRRLKKPNAAARNLRNFL